MNILTLSAYLGIVLALTVGSAMALENMSSSPIGSGDEPCADNLYVNYTCETTADCEVYARAPYNLSQIVDTYFPPNTPIACLDGGLCGHNFCGPDYDCLLAGTCGEAHVIGGTSPTASSTLIWLIGLLAVGAVAYAVTRKKKGRRHT